MTSRLCQHQTSQYILQTILEETLQADNLDGHAVTGLETLTLPSSMQHFQDMGGANAYYDNKTKFIVKSMQTMTQ